MMAKGRNLTRYAVLIERVFQPKFRRGVVEVPFDRTELEDAARDLSIKLPKNLGDVLYALRYRVPMPASILATQPPGKEWVIEGAGRAKYVFKLGKINRIEPNSKLIAVKVPDSTPELVGAYALSDEQALLARVRYNRLVDVFLGVAAYSLQNHLRTSVKGLGQVEIDEIYVAIDGRGRQFVVPVQAKGGADRLSAVQTKQDFACCAEKFPRLICRSVSAQFLADDVIALFELALDGDSVRVVDERHYRLVPARDISQEDLDSYAR